MMTVTTILILSNIIITSSLTTKDRAEKWRYTEHQKAVRIIPYYENIETLNPPNPKP